MKNPVAAWWRRALRAIVRAAMPRSPDFADERALAAVGGAVPPDPISAAVTAVLAGDAGRFADIVHAFDAVVRRTVARTLRDVHALEDVVQEVWVRVYRQLATLVDLRSAEAWIGRIARNCVLDHHRARQRLPRPGLDAAGVPAGERDGWVWDLVDTLPGAQRELLQWCYRDALGYADIAARLGVPASTVRGRLYDARLALRARIEQRNRT